MSIVLANIDVFHGNKMNSKMSFKMNDGRLELVTFESQTDSTNVASISGDIKMSLESEKSVYIQVNDTSFRLINPKSLTIRKAEKYRIIINKETLEC